MKSSSKIWWSGRQPCSPMQKGKRNGLKLRVSLFAILVHITMCN